MTEEELIDLARQANGEETWPGGVDWTWEELQTFAKLVEKKEREACAEICENYGDEAFVDGRINADNHAYLIRQRGQA